MSPGIFPSRAGNFEAANAFWCFMDTIALCADDTPDAFSRFLERTPDTCYAAWQVNDLLLGVIMAGGDICITWWSNPSFVNKGSAWPWSSALLKPCKRKASVNAMPSSTGITLPHVFLAEVRSMIDHDWMNIISSDYYGSWRL